MTSETREVRNQILANLSDLPLSQTAKGAKVGLTQQMVSYVLKNLGVKKTLRKTGAKPRLSAEQLGKLPVFLLQGAEFYGFEGAYWTHQRVQFVIEKEFGVVYQHRQAGRLLAKIGWTRQKPQKKICVNVHKK
jgi:transposase